MYDRLRHAWAPADRSTPGRAAISREQLLALQETATAFLPDQATNSHRAILIRAGRGRGPAARPGVPWSWCRGLPHRGRGSWVEPCGALAAVASSVLVALPVLMGVLMVLGG